MSYRENYGLIDWSKDLAPVQKTRRDIPRVANVISDTMAPTRHMASGEMIDSKSKFRATTKAHGCIEVGNETLKPRQPIKLDRGQRREHIRQAIYEARNGR